MDEPMGRNISLTFASKLQETQDPRSLPLPWSSSFSGQLVVCRPGVASAEPSCFVVADLGDVSGPQKIERWEYG